MKIIEKIFLSELALVFIASLLTLGSGYEILLAELLAISLALSFFLGSWLIEEGEDERIRMREAELHNQFGDKVFVMDDMRRARGLALAGNLLMFTLAAIFATGINRNPDLVMYIVASLLLMPAWFLLFRYADYITIVTPDFVEKNQIGFRDRFDRINWNNVSYVGLSWNNGFAEASINHLNGYSMKVQMSKPDVRFRDLVYTILDHVPETRLDGSFREYRKEREALKNQQASTKPL